MAEVSPPALTNTKSKCCKLILVCVSFRPIAGYANLCPAMISSQPQEFEGMLSTVKHEIIHALVSAATFFFYSPVVFYT